MAEVYLGLGANLGRRQESLVGAITQLAQLGALRAVSSVYETAPRNGPPQPAYLNAVVKLDTRLTPRELLNRALAIEKAWGRTRTIRFGPRTLDIDLLLYDHCIISEAGLEIPHPRLFERRFVLEPLAEIAPTLAFPDQSQIADRLRQVSSQEVIAQWPMPTFPQHGTR